MGKTIGFIFSDDEIIVRNWLGKLGAFSAHKFLKVWFGIASYGFSFLAFLAGIRVLFKVRLLPLLRSTQITIVTMVWLSLAMGFLFDSSIDFMGGHFGGAINHWLENVVGRLGAGTFVIFSGFIAVVVLFNPSLSWFSKEAVSEFIEEEEREAVNTITEEEIIEEAPSEAIDLSEEKEEEKTVEEIKVPLTPDIEMEVEVETNEPEIEVAEALEETPSMELESTIDTQQEPEILAPTTSTTEEEDNGEMEVVAPEAEEELSTSELDEKMKEFGEFDPKLELSQYQLPGIDILVDHGGGKISVNKDELEANKNKIIETLLNYKIEISKIKATIGPTVTLYEIVPAPGVRISKIKNLEDDIALSLAALGIRIIAPMPGKGTVGIEVPNSSPDIVSMRSLLASEKFQNNDMELPVALGKTISNETFITDLTKMPHLLMAGATGQGKSVGLNAILVSILYKKHPSQVKFVLVDPKKVELAIYNKIERHFLAKLPDDGDAHYHRHL